MYEIKRKTIVSEIGAIVFLCLVILKKMWKTSKKGGTHMLREWKATEKPEEGELKKRLIAARDKLARQQMLIKEKKIPVLVLRRVGERLEREAASESYPKH